MQKSVGVLNSQFFELSMTQSQANIWDNNTQFNQFGENKNDFQKNKRNKNKLQDLNGNLI